jgi:leucyl/phenylalanyl-tRNA--protein transferase
MRLTPELLVRAYSCGLFPMAESAASDDLRWFDPSERGILPLEGLHVPRRLARVVRQNRFTVTVDTDFRSVVKACAEATEDRPKTWINADIVDAYCALHAQGMAHCVECRRDGRLVGGLYGVALGGAFFGESMFSRERDASKVALVHLVARLRAGGFTLLDTQFPTDHLARLGGIAIGRAAYRRRLAAALEKPAMWPDTVPTDMLADVLGRPSPV